MSKKNVYFFLIAVGIFLFHTGIALADAGGDYDIKDGSQYRYYAGDVGPSSIYPDGVMLSEGSQIGYVKYLFTIPEYRRVTELYIYYVGQDNTFWHLGTNKILLYNWDTDKYDLMVNPNDNEPSIDSTWGFKVQDIDKYVDSQGRILVQFYSSADAQYHIKQVGIDYRYNYLETIHKKTDNYDFGNTYVGYSPEDFPESNVRITPIDTSYPVSDLIVAQSSVNKNTGQMELLTLSQQGGFLETQVAASAAEIGDTVLIPEDGDYKVSVKCRIKGKIGAGHSAGFSVSQESASSIFTYLSVSDSSTNELIADKMFVDEYILDTDLSEAATDLTLHALSCINIASTVIGDVQFPFGLTLTSTADFLEFESKDAISGDPIVTGTVYLTDLKKGSYNISLKGSSGTQEIIGATGWCFGSADLSSVKDVSLLGPYVQIIDEQYDTSDGIWLEEIRVEKIIENEPIPEIEISYSPNCVQKDKITDISVTFTNMEQTAILYPNFYFDGRPIGDSDSLKPEESVTCTFSVDSNGYSVGDIITGELQISGSTNNGFWFDRKYDISFDVVEPDPENTKTVSGTISNSVTTDSISVTASYSEDTNDNGYAELYYKLSSSPDWSNSYSMDKNNNQYSKTITNLLQNTEYDIKVEYFDSDGIIGSNPITKSNVKTAQETVDAPNTPNLYDINTVSTSGNFILYWSPQIDASYYTIEENGASTNTYTSDVSQYAITGKENGVYSYKVKACNEYGCSEWSNTVSVTVNLEDLSENVYSGTLHNEISIPTTDDVREYTQGIYKVAIIGRDYLETDNPQKASADIYKNGNLIKSQTLTECEPYYFDDDNLQILLVDGYTVKIPGAGDETFGGYAECISISTKTTSEVSATPNNLYLSPGENSYITLEFPYELAYDFYFTGSAKDWASKYNNKIVKITVPSDTAIGSYQLSIFANTGGDGDPAYSIRDLIITIEEPNSAPAAPALVSQTSFGFAETPSYFIISSTDPEIDNIKCIIDWGDGTSSETDFVESGNPVTVNHIWINQGAYNVKAKAIDASGKSSDWSSLLTFNVNELHIVDDRYVFEGSDLSEITNGGCIEINPQNFYGFSYDLDDDIGTEKIRIYNNYVTDPRTIEPNGLVYSTETKYTQSKADFGNLSYYGVVSLFGKEYVPVYGCEYLAELVIDSDDKYVLEADSQLELGNGYVLKINDYDFMEERVQMELYKDGETIANEWLDLGYGADTWSYEIGVTELDSVPVFKLLMTDVFVGQSDVSVVVEGLWLIDFVDTVTINAGDSTGMLETTSVGYNLISMSNPAPIVLSPVTEQELIAGILIETADSSDVRFRFKSNNSTSELRGLVVEGSFVPEWNYTNFPGFYYDIDSNVDLESLRINSIDYRFVEEENLIYETNICEKTYECPIWSSDTYYLTSFFTEPHVVCKNNGVDMFAKLVIDSGEEMVLNQDIPLYIGDGYEIVLKDVLLTQADIDLMRYGKTIDSMPIYVGNNEFTIDINGEPQTFMKANVGSMNSVGNKFVTINDLWLVDKDNIFSIENGLGIFEIESMTEDHITFINDGTFVLPPDSFVEIYKQFGFNVADDDFLRFYPVTKNNIIEAAMPEANRIECSKGEIVSFTLESEQITSFEWLLDGNYVQSDEWYYSSYETDELDTGIHKIKVIAEKDGVTEERSWLIEVVDSSANPTSYLKSVAYSGSDLPEIVHEHGITVSDNWDNQPYNCLEFNATNFDGFFSDPGAGVLTEVLRIYDEYYYESLSEREIPEDLLEYRTTIAFADFNASCLNESYHYFNYDSPYGYPVISLFGEEYIPLDFGSPEYLAKLVQDSDESTILYAGESIDLGDGFSLKLKSIDAEGYKAWLEFYRFNELLGDEVIDCTSPEGATWWYDLDVASVNDVIVFGVHIKESNFSSIIIDGTWLIDYENLLHVKYGDEFGNMEVDSVDSSISMRNKVPFVFNQGTKIDIVDDFYFEVADISDLSFQLVGKMQKRVVSNSLPTATISSINPNLAVDGQYVSFEGTGADSDGTIIEYNWTSSIDGHLSTMPSFSTSDLSVGTHTIYLKVKDNEGEWSDSYSTTFTMVSKNPMKIIGSCDLSRAYDVSLSDHYAYVASGGSGLAIVDVSDPESPTIVGNCDTTGSAEDVFISGNYAYIADGFNEGLAIINISNPQSPSIASVYDNIKYAAGVAVEGNYAYVADEDSSGLKIINISNPESPRFVSNCDDALYAKDVVLSGNYAYAACANFGLVIINITNPELPTFAGSYETSWAESVAIVDDYAYIADYADGLVIVSISNPESPEFVSSYGTGDATVNVAVKGNYAYVADSANGVVVLDISEPTIISLEDSYDTPNSAVGIAVASNYVYVADSRDLVILQTNALLGSNNPPTSTITSITPSITAKWESVSFEGSYDDLDGTVIGYKWRSSIDGQLSTSASFSTFDLSVGTHTIYFKVQDDGGIWSDADSATVTINPRDPISILGSYNTPGDAYDVALSDDYAYVADGESGLVIVNVINPELPTLAGSYDTAGYAYDVALSDGYAYVADNNNGLAIVDITSPSSPKYVGRYDTPGYAYEVFTEGNYAYVADSENGLVILNITKPSSPTLAGSYSTAGYVGDVAVSGDYAYLARGRNGLLIIDISNPESPEYTGSYGAADIVSNVVVADNYAYAIDFDNGLLILDISDPKSPLLAANFDTGENTLGVEISGDYAYILKYVDNPSSPGSSYSILLIVDISSPLSPTLVDSFNLPGTAWNTAIFEDYAYVPTGANGLVILQTDLPPALNNPPSSTTFTANVETIDGTGYFSNPETGTLISLETSEDITDTISISESQFSSLPLPQDAVGIHFLDVQLGSIFAEKLTNAKVSITVNEELVPDGLTIQDVSIFHYNDEISGWEELPTAIENINGKDYWFTHVAHFSTYAAIAINSKPPITNFEADRFEGQVPLTIQFTDLSTDAMSWSWDVDGDGIEDSNSADFSYTYLTPGSYDVSLTVTNDDGTDTETKYGYITVNEASEIIFSITDNTEKVVLGSELMYEITLTNNKGVELTNVQIVDELPSELTFVSASGTTFDESTNTVILDIGNLIPGESAISHITVRATSCGSIENSVTMYCGQEDSISCEDLTTIVTQEEIPEFPTIAIPMFIVITMVGLFTRRRE